MAQCHYCKKTGHIATVWRSHSKTTDTRQDNFAQTQSSRPNPEQSKRWAPDHQKKSIPLQASNVTLTSYTGDSISVRGQIDVFVEYADQSATLPLLLKEMKYQGLFATDLGVFNGPLIKLWVNKDAPPHFFKPRVVPYCQKEKIEVKLECLQQLKVITTVKFFNWAALFLSSSKMGMLGSVGITKSQLIKSPRQKRILYHELKTCLQPYRDVRFSLNWTSAVLINKSLFMSTLTNILLSTHIRVYSSTFDYLLAFHQPRKCSSKSWKPSYKGYLKSVSI
uniref:Uncharacterized protein n=1 Tax=Amphimedon queenslandica TaxID=400682 RepID=A0A1X7VL07_AMPQE